MYSEQSSHDLNRRKQGRIYRNARVRLKTKSSGLNQEPTRNKVPGFGSWYLIFSFSWYLFWFLVCYFQTLLVQPGTSGLNSWFKQEVIGLPGINWFDQEENLIFLSLHDHIKGGS